MQELAHGAQNVDEQLQQHATYVWSCVLVYVLAGSVDWLESLSAVVRVSFRCCPSFSSFEEPFPAPTVLSIPSTGMVVLPSSSCC